MKERGKAVEVFSNDMFDQDYSTSSDFPCKKHPSASSVGICAYCLKDRLVNLVCSDCGEQRLSSCSCSEVSPNRNSCNFDVGSVGRISFLIENDKKNESLINSSSSKAKSSSSNGEKHGEVLLLKRSSSSCVEIHRKGGFWRIGRLFRKKKEKGGNCERNSVCGFEEKNDLWVVDYMGVSRSRSLCSFRGGGFFGSEDGTFSGARSSISGARSSISGARSSISAARSSGVNGGLLYDPDRKSGFSEAEPRKSGFDATFMDSERVDPAGHNGSNTRRVFSLREGNFTTDSGFIDLKFDFPSESKTEFSGGKNGYLSDSASAFSSMRGGEIAGQDHCGSYFGSVTGDYSHGGSCRVTVSDRGIKRSRKSFKSWRWIFRHSPSNSTAKKKDSGGENVVKPPLA